MRVLTSRQRAYLEKLKQRNAQLIREGDTEKTRKLWYSGLSNSMTSGERKMRQRIRKNAITAMFDLALTGHAGVLPDRGQRKQGITGVERMLKDVCFTMVTRMVCQERDKDSVTKTE